jgi:hypothetical protein
MLILAPSAVSCFDVPVVEAGQSRGGQMLRILAVAGLSVALVTAVAGPGAAATSVSSAYAVAGIETSIPTNNTSTFAGSALGSSFDTASWKASVVHQALSSCPFGSGTSCAITGGLFSLTSSSGAQVSGSFTGGTVTPVSQQAPCGKQIFGVAGTLATTSGQASFAATLTHYRTLLLGTCVTYFATITGSVLFG